MQSSPGSLSPQAQPAFSLAILALAALGISLLLAIAALPKARIVTPPARHAVVATPASRPFPMAPSNTAPVAAPASNVPRTQGTVLEPLLIPWAIGIDALALVGLAVVVIVRRSAKT